MAASADDKAARQSTTSRSQRPRSSGSHPESGSAAASGQGLIGEIRMEAGPALSAATRHRIRGLNVLAQTAAPEKEKVSITLDKPLVDQIRAQFGGRALSTSINELLYAALAQEHLAELVDEMEQEAGPASPEAYERVLAQWFDEG
jgi:uncharacterized protein (DUF4415 family)